MSEDLIKYKPRSNNTFVAFFQRIWRWWLGVWYAFEAAHPKLAKFISQFVVYWLISNLITVVQYLIFLFLPDLLGIRLAGIEWWWPNNLKIPFKLPNGETPYWHILGYAVLHDEAGSVIIGGGLGYMIAFAIGTFVAQVINFPMQRNLTYRSHGNPWWQGMWYIIGWFLINLLSNAINGLWAPFGEAMLDQWLYKLLDTFIMGTISLWLYFLIFKIIFPDLTAQAKSEENRLAKMDKRSKSYKRLSAKHLETVELSERSVADKAEYQAIKLAEAKAIAWEAVKKRVEKLSSSKNKEKLSKAESLLKDKYNEALNAAIKCDEAIAENRRILIKYGALPNDKVEKLL